MQVIQGPRLGVRATVLCTVGQRRTGHRQNRGPNSAIRCQDRRGIKGEMTLSLDGSI
jgi:hypothetical protein